MCYNENCSLAWLLYLGVVLRFGIPERYVQENFPGYDQYISLQGKQKANFYRMYRLSSKSGDALAIESLSIL